jgi:hypothetical protein
MISSFSLIFLTYKIGRVVGVAVFAEPLPIRFIKSQVL